MLEETEDVYGCGVIISVVRYGNSNDKFTLEIILSSAEIQKYCMN
jgi:hypothetical protein